MPIYTSCRCSMLSCVEYGHTIPEHFRLLAAVPGCAIPGRVIGSSPLAQALTPPAGGADVLRKQVIAGSSQRALGRPVHIGTVLLGDYSRLREMDSPRHMLNPCLAIEGVHDV